ncbi:hypothetical protein KEM52_005169 [Ascosphaera acerosa]|nr:hypothetical protein KEM52_005169 [Ascosphaera acerosa]
MDVGVGGDSAQPPDQKLASTGHEMLDVQDDSAAAFHNDRQSLGSVQKRLAAPDSTASDQSYGETRLKRPRCNGQEDALTDDGPSPATSSQLIELKPEGLVATPSHQSSSESPLSVALSLPDPQDVCQETTYDTASPESGSEEERWARELCEAAGLGLSGAIAAVSQAQEERLSSVPLAAAAALSVANPGELQSSCTGSQPMSESLGQQPWSSSTGASSAQVQTGMIATQTPATSTIPREAEWLKEQLKEADGMQPEHHCAGQPSATETIGANSRPSLAASDPQAASEATPASETPCRPPPSGQPPAWAETRSELCETIPWFNAAQSGLYHRQGYAYGLLIDRDSGGRSYMDDEIIITRIGGGCSFRNGRLVQTKGHSSATRALAPVVGSMEKRIPVGVIVGNRNTICPTSVPHRYNVADFFRITHVWFEKLDGQIAGRMRYEKCDVETRSWWALPDSTSPLPLNQRDSPSPQDLQQTCQRCGAPSLLTFSVGWMCLNYQCDDFYKVDGEDVSELSLSYDTGFVRMRTRFTDAPKPPYSLVPSTLQDLIDSHIDNATARICWRGIVCPRCSKCVCRRLWRGWQCETPGCGFSHLPGIVPAPLRLVIPGFEMGAAGHSVPLKLTRGELRPTITYMKQYRKDVFVIPDMGTVIHLAANRVVNSREGGPDDMFRQLQAEDLGLARHPLTNSMIPQMLTAHFAVNYGMPYKYVVNVDKRRSDQTPAVIVNALGRLRWAAQQVGSDHVQMPNELLAVGYFEKMSMGYHDDGGNILGPTIVSLSLGSPAEMTIRMKKKYWKPLSKDKFDYGKEVIIPGCGLYEQRLHLREQRDAGQISAEQYEDHRAQLLRTIKGSECPPVIRMELSHGDMVVMHGSRLQMFYEHAVEPKGDLRFALTGRYIKPETIPKSPAELEAYQLPDAILYDVYLSAVRKEGPRTLLEIGLRDKADRIRAAHAEIPEDRLSFAIVPDIAQLDAFDEAIKSDPPFEAVIHTASPFHFNAQDVQKDLLDPAVNGTLGILQSIKKSAPTVKKVVITSSFAAIMNMTKKIPYTFSEADWNPVTLEQAIADPTTGYVASKAFAEKAAWKFVEEEKPNFALATICPPMVYGPIVSYLNSLSSLNTSNQMAGNIAAGAFAGKRLPPTAFPVWVDVRDVALAHVLAMEKKEASGKRFFTINGLASNKDIAEVIRDNFPEYRTRIPSGEGLETGALAGPWYGVDNTRSKEVLGLDYTTFEASVVDTISSLKPFLDAPQQERVML